MIILVCGKICAGKSSYAKKLMRELPAVRLNPDEMMKTLFGEYLGDRHEEVLCKTLALCFQKSLEINACGIHVIMDFGFWQKHWREKARAFYAAHDVMPEWHYIHVNDAAWKRNIEARNRKALLPGSTDYYVDENILRKFSDPADEFVREEVDVWVENN